MESPVADARTERGPESGISGEPRIITGFVAWRISGTSWSIKWLNDSI